MVISKRKTTLKHSSVFILLFMFILLSPLVMGFEFDNVKDYNPITREVIITNALGLGADIGKTRLNTPLNVKVGAGYQKVAEFDVWAYQDYNDIIKEFSFTDMKSEKTISREIDVKYKSYETIVVNDYKTICSIPKDAKLNINGTISEVCEQVLIGSHNETKETWTLKPTTNLLKDEIITIGLFTNVQIGDYVDWIPTIYGIEVEEWATWTADLNVDLIAYYKLDDNLATTNVIDSVGSYNGTASGNTNTLSATGHIGTSFDFVGGSSEYVNLNAMMTALGDDTTGSHSFWMRMADSTPSGNEHLVMFGDAASNNVNYRILMLPTGKLMITFYDGTATQWRFTTDDDVISDNTWHHMVMVQNGTSPVLYVDGSLVDISFATSTDTTQWLNDIVTDVGTIGAYRNGAATNEYYTGKIDEIGFWSRALTSTEVTQLNNGETGITYTDEFGSDAPNITLNSPSSANYTTNQNIVMNFTAWDDVKLSDVKLYVNDVLNQTNASGINNSNYLFDLSLTDGNYTIYGKATDNESQETNSSSIIIQIDTTPDIQYTANTEINNYNSTTSYLPIEVTLTETYFDTISFNVNGTVTNYTDGTRLFNQSYTDGTYTYNVTVYTTTGQSNSTTTRTINIDTTAPNITDAIGLDNIVTTSLPINSTWNYTASDDHIGSCYFNSTANATQTIIVCNSTTITSWTTAGNKTITYCANDTFGNENCNTDYLYVYSLTETQTDTPDPIAEGFDATFNFIVNLTSIPTTTAILYLNSTAYSPTTTAGTNGYEFDVVVEIPDGWGNTTGIVQDYYWNYTITGITTEETTDTDNITVYELAFDNCTTYGDVIFNFSVLDEELLTVANESLSITVDTDLTLTSKTNSSITLDYSNTWNKNNNPQICLPSGVINNSQYFIDLTVGFSSVDHVWEFYYIDSGTLNSTKVYETFGDKINEDINLMDLLTADSTSFLFNYFDTSGLAVDGAIVHVMRKYIGSGIFREVERAKSDENGDTIVHLVEEDVIYYFLITKDGELLYTTSEYTALCQATPCTIQIEASGEGAVFPTDWDLMDNGAYSITSSSSTRNVTLTYETNTSTTMNFTVYKYESDGSYTVIETGDDTGSSGNITLTIPQVAGNISFFASVDQDGEFLISEWVDFEEDATTVFGSTLAIFLTLLIVLSLGLMAISEGAMTVVYVTLGLLVSGALGLIVTDLSTGISVIVYLVIAGGLILWKLSGGKN